MIQTIGGGWVVELDMPRGDTKMGLLLTGVVDTVLQILEIFLALSRCNQDDA